MRNSAMISFQSTRSSVCLLLLLLTMQDVTGFAASPYCASSTFHQGTSLVSFRGSPTATATRPPSAATTTPTTRTPVQLHSSASSLLFSSDFEPTNNRHSASDWWYNVQSILQSTILKEVRGPVVAVAVWSAVVSILHRLLATTYNSAAWAGHLCIPGTAHSFLVSSLGLLLVFRTNSAYQRFYEGRKIWENILSISRNISRMVQLYSADVGHKRQVRIRNLVAAFPYMLRHHIRPGCLCARQVVNPTTRLRLIEPSLRPVETRHEGDRSSTRTTATLSSSSSLLWHNAATTATTTTPSSLLLSIPTRECYVDKRQIPWSLLTPKALEQVAVAHNRPLWICDRLGQHIMNIPYSPNFTSRERLSLLSQIEKLTNAVGQCERIQQTAVPLNYARHSLRSLTLWHFTLPFCLIKDFGLLTAPVAAGIAWVLFGVYQIGYSIEDPFQGSLRLSILCDAIRRDVIGDTTTAGEEQQQLDVPATLPVHSTSSPPQPLPLFVQQLQPPAQPQAPLMVDHPKQQQQLQHSLPLQQLVSKEHDFLKAVENRVPLNGTWNLVREEGP